MTLAEAIANHRSAAIPAKPAVITAGQCRRLFSDDKRELDQMIEVQRRNGWLLVSRSHSMEDGHGAVMMRKDAEKA